MKKSTIALVVLQVLILVLLGIVIAYKEVGTKLVAECPEVNPPAIVEEVVNEEIVEMPEGWYCDAPRTIEEGGSTDLMQPSGYWNMDHVICYKNITPISELCKKEPYKSRCEPEQISGEWDPKP